MKIMENLLEKFIFVSDTSSKETFDLKLVLKALPYSVNEQNVYRVGMYHFNVI